MKLFTLIFLTMSVSLMAQVPDTTYVPTDMDDPLNNVGVIKATIEADTLADGSHPGGVYILKRGAVYPFNEMVNTFGGHLQILGEAGPYETAPAFLISWLSPDQATQNRHKFMHHGDVTIKDVAFTATGSDLEISDGRFLYAIGDSSTVMLQHIFCDNGGRIGQSNGAQYQDIIFDDIFIRNANKGYWIGGSPRFVKVTNWTSYNLSSGATPIGLGSGIPRDTLIVDHTTFVYSQWGMFQNEFMANVIVKNSIQLDAAYWGDNLESLNRRPPGCDPIAEPHEADAYVQWEQMGDTEMEQAGYSDSSEIWIDFDNNCLFNSVEMQAVFDSNDSLFINTLVRGAMRCNFFESDDYPLITMDKMVLEDPQFTNLVNDFSVFKDKVYANKLGRPAVPNFVYDFDGDDNPLTLAWPPTLNAAGPDLDLTPQNPKLVNGGTDGYNVGSLAHWAPEQYKAWLGEDVGTSIEDKTVSTVPGVLLEQNYPNPFNRTTEIKYNLVKSSDVTLTVHNMVGQKVATLFTGLKAAGTHTVNFDAANLTSGVYFYTLSAGDVKRSKMMMLQ